MPEDPLRPAKNARKMPEDPLRPTSTHFDPLRPAKNARGPAKPLKPTTFGDMGGNFDRKIWMHFLGSKITFGENVKTLVKLGEFSESGRFRQKCQKRH